MIHQNLRLQLNYFKIFVGPQLHLIFKIIVLNIPARNMIIILSEKLIRIGLDMTNTAVTFAVLFSGYIIVFYWKNP